MDIMTPPLWMQSLHNWEYYILITSMVGVLSAFICIGVMFIVNYFNTKGEKL